MQEDRTAELLNLIGQLLAEDTEYPLDDTLLHAEVERASVAPSIFKDRGNHILYRDPDLNRLGDALLDLWDAQQGPNRWAEIEYIVRNGRFDATFVYPEEIDPTEEPLDRRRRIVVKHFGDKPIIYPPDEDDDVFDI
ncbi:hypothetical protein E5A74_15715 [Sphingomonas naasensis]|uniref:Uncharacterized protein n=1 Tax=Sphingomonas naasensis TaxID=1344951 RepID=A0A4S1WF72_9SPHN|nr:hypothetical protein [Sphingomonas naasensis]TGX40160.1 hypothetical protein E5A74_15715 [Sphingomonas naasensis]